MLSGVDLQHEAPDTGMLMVAGDAVGASAGAEFDFAQLKALLEFRPFLFGGFAVFGCGADGPVAVKEGPVVLGQVFLEDGRGWPVRSVSPARSRASPSSR
ncbi:hypothetical protein ACQEU3_39210 [Spirillospora sp. CA-253888]